MKIPIDLTQRPLSYSSLKEFRKSPKHYVQYVTEPRKPPSPAQIIGSAFEILLLDNDRFDTKVMVFEKPNLRSNAGKDEWENIQSQAEGRLMITAEQYETVCAMVDNAHNCAEMMRYVDSINKTQQKLTWKDKTGIPFIGYVDAEGTIADETWVFEIKTAASADPDQFVRDFYKWDYHIQIATYAEGYKRKYFAFPNFAVLVFETSEPYNCAPYMIESKTLDQAKDEWRASVDAFKFCMDNDFFDQGYEFLLQAMDYFALRQPGYYKPRFGGES